MALRHLIVRRTHITLVCGAGDANTAIAEQLELIRLDVRLPSRDASSPSSPLVVHFHCSSEPDQSERETTSQLPALLPDGLPISRWNTSRALKRLRGLRMSFDASSYGLAAFDVDLHVSLLAQPHLRYLILGGIGIGLAVASPVPPEMSSVAGAGVQWAGTPDGRECRFCANLLRVIAATRSLLRIDPP